MYQDRLHSFWESSISPFLNWVEHHLIVFTIHNFIWFTVFAFLSHFQCHVNFIPFDLMDFFRDSDLYFFPSVCLYRLQDYFWIISSPIFPNGFLCPLIQFSPFHSSFVSIWSFILSLSTFVYCGWLSLILFRYLALNYRLPSLRAFARTFASMFILSTGL